MCNDCIEKRKMLPGYTCVLCALGLSLGSDNVVKDPFTGTIHIDLSGEGDIDKLSPNLGQYIGEILEGKIQPHLPEETS